MKIDYRELNPISMPGLIADTRMLNKVYDDWGEELLSSQMEQIREIFDNKDLAHEVDRVVHSAYVALDCRLEGAFSFMSLHVDASAEKLRLKVLRVPPESNPFRQKAEDAACDCVDAISAVPVGRDALQLLSELAKKEPTVVTAPKHVLVELAAYLSAYGIMKK